MLVYMPFSPLLIGESSATCARLLEGQVPANRDFQSPPHRGIFCDGRQRRLRPMLQQIAMPFSPLLIGESSATCDAVLEQWIWSSFSPLLIGESSATCSVLRGERASASISLSVPSSSGNLLRLPGTSPVSVHPGGFQSPPHRGIFCDERLKRSSGFQASRLSVPSSSGNLLRLRRRRLECRNGFLSVPSSSGNLLRLGIGRVRLHRTVESFQSPPHRGIFCDVARAVARLWAALHFQSPPHRGIFCDSFSCWGPAALTLISFSPLLIGESSATNRRDWCSSPPQDFQSPPHRGIFCDLTIRTRMESVCEAILSVPSSSGPMGITLMAFSPLLIGESSATCA